MDMASLGIASVSAITVLCLLAGEIVKVSEVDSKWIPIICGGVGMLLGILGMIVMPEYPANDFITAAAVGVVSGLAATGINQAFKQLGGNKDGDC